MSPPPVTPSPHRFIIRKQAPPRNTPLAQEHTPQRPSTRPSSLQFNATPRFNFSSTPGPTGTQDLPASTPASSRFVTPARPVPNIEDVVDYSSDDHLQDADDSIKTDVQEADIDYDSVNDDGYAIDSRSPKRRRLSSSSTTMEDNYKNDDDDHDSILSSLPLLSSPQAPRRQVTSTAPRFLISTPLPPSTPQPDSQQPKFVKPVQFRLPDPSSESQANAEPLPEQFSPHRRGQKYLAGGLAAEVRGWLMNIESAVPANYGQKKKVDSWTMKLVIDEISGGGRTGMTLVQGRHILVDAGEEMAGMIDNRGIVKVVLAGEGADTELQKGKKVEVGNMVGIKGPLWEIEIEGEKWGVGVDWKVLP